jgi:hypothetical protein
MKHFWLSLFCLGLISAASAQTLSTSKEANPALYTIQLGVFDEAVKQADFEAIRSYAYVYKREGTIFVGSFTNEEAAEPILAKIKAKGFDDAFVVAKSLKKSKSVYIIQLATMNAGEPISWKTYSRAGELFTMPTASQVRIVHGAYEDKNDANVKLREIQALGFADAFVKMVKELQLNPVTDFDGANAKFFVKTPQTTVSVQDVPASYGVVQTKSVKRKTVIKLQEALKELGMLGTSPDGLYGKATQTSFDRAMQLNRRLKSFNELAQKHEGFEDWTDVRLTMTMARELSVKDEPTPIVADLLQNLPDTPLSTKEANEALNWHTATWKKLETWSATSQYNDQVYSAFKVAYYHSLVHLEDYFSTKGIRGEAGTALSVSVLKTLIGSDLEGFN